MSAAFLAHVRRSVAQSWRHRCGNCCPLPSMLPRGMPRYVMDKHGYGVEFC